MRRFVPFLAVALAPLGACTDTTDPHDHDEGELITTVELTFTPLAGGDAIVATWADPEGDGDPVIDAITLSDADDYDLTIRFLDELSDPVEDITEEIADEAEEHQIFVTGTAVMGPASTVQDPIVVHTYTDADANGLPVGLDNAITTEAAGTGELTITLRHLPPEGDEPTKVVGLAADVMTGGFSAIPGDTDAQVTFDLTVEAAAQ